MIINGDSLTILKTIDTNSIDMCITSPPYYKLRDYGIKNQIGLEKTVEEYIKKLLNIFAEVKRVLKPTGSCWINIADTYAGTQHRDNSTKVKSQYGIPERLVVGMLNQGWIKRNTIIWHKPSCLPSSAKDRFTNDFEYLFFFVISKKYYFTQQFEPYSEVYLNDKRHNKTKLPTNTKYPTNIQGGCKTRNNIFGAGLKEGRNKRTVWSINPARFAGAHFATFPESLITTPIISCCPPGGIVLDPFAGSGTTKLVANKLGRKSLMIELNNDYIEIMKNRCKEK